MSKFVEIGGCRFHILSMLIRRRSLQILTPYRETRALNDQTKAPRFELLE
jgi:hypothetical protein